LIGYRSQIALAPPLKLGVFCVGTTDADDSSQSILTQPVLSLIATPLASLLWTLQQNISLPPNAAVFTGIYSYPDPIDGIALFQVYITDGQMYSKFTGEGAGMLMTPYLDNIFRVKGPWQDCRWYNDGMNDEFIYFTLNEAKSAPISLVFMGTTAYFVTKN